MFFDCFDMKSAYTAFMPKRSRIIVPRNPLHITQLGNNRHACFFADEDYLFYLDWLKETNMVCPLFCYYFAIYLRILQKTTNFNKIGKL